MIDVSNPTEFVVNDDRMDDLVMRGDEDVADDDNRITTIKSLFCCSPFINEHEMFETAYQDDQYTGHVFPTVLLAFLERMGFSRTAALLMQEMDCKKQYVMVWLCVPYFRQIFHVFSRRALKSTLQSLEQVMEEMLKVGCNDEEEEKRIMTFKERLHTAISRKDGSQQRKQFNVREGVDLYPGFNKDNGMYCAHFLEIVGGFVCPCFVSLDALMSCTGMSYVMYKWMVMCRPCILS